MTSTFTVHVPPPAIVPPVKEMEPAPALGVNVPPQEVDPFGVAATTIFPGEVGNVSVKATPLKLLF